MTKYMIITDERCGGTSFMGIVKTISGQRCIDDPATYISRLEKGHDVIQWFGDDVDLKQFINSNYNYVDVLHYLYSIKINVIKLSLVSPKVTIQMDNILSYCKNNNIKVIFLERGDKFERTISKCRAEVTRNYDIRTVDETITIEPAKFIDRYKRHLLGVEKLNKSLKNLYTSFDNVAWFLYESFYTDTNELYRLCTFLGVEYNNLPNEIKKWIDNDYKKKYNQAETVITNIDELKSIYKKLLE